MRGDAGRWIVLATVVTPMLAGCGPYIFADVTNGCGTAIAVSSDSTHYFTDLEPGETTRLEGVGSRITAWLGYPADNGVTLAPADEDLGERDRYDSVSWEDLVEAGANVEGGEFEITGDLCPDAQR